MSLGPLHQIAIASGPDLDAAIAFYRDTLGLTFLGRFDPPAIAFFAAGGTRIMLSGDAPKGQLYLTSENLDADAEALAARGVAFKSDPVLVHRDEAGQFGRAGDEEWMRFFEDPAGNLLALAERCRPY